MLIRSSWRLVANVRNSNILCHKIAFRNSFSTHQQAAKDSSLIWKIFAGGSLIIGGPVLYYRYSLKKHDQPSKQQADHYTQTKSTSTSDTKCNLIENLPASVPYLIIGGGPSGFSAARTIRANDSTARVLIVTDENHYPYSRTPLTKELWFSGLDPQKLSFQQFNGKERSIYFEHEEFYLPLEEFETSSHGGISVVKSHKITKLDVNNQKAFLDNGQMISYDKCIIATGTKPRNLKIFEEASPQIQDRIILYNTPEDYQRLHELLPGLKSITIIGNGFTASEMAFSLTERSKKLRSNVKINQVFVQNGILDQILPTFLSNWCTERIKDENVNVITNTRIENVQFDKNQLLLKLSNGDTLNTDICIVDVGKEPNIDLAHTSNLEVDSVNGGFLTNAELQIRSNLWVTGDVASFYDENRGRRRDCQHDNAIFTGRLVGENVTSSKGKPYIHNPRFWSDLGPDIGFEAIGQINAEFPTFCMFAKDGESQSEREKYGRGVLFYLKNDQIVGIILWNIFDVDNMHKARKVLHDGFQNQDLNEVAKMFALYPSALTSEADNNDVSPT